MVNIYVPMDSRKYLPFRKLPESAKVANSSREPVSSYNLAWKVFRVLSTRATSRFS